MNLISRTLWGSLLATAEMTIFMMAVHRKLPEKERSPLPPATITKDLLSVPRGEAAQNASLLSHFAYGVGLAGIYTLMRRRESRRLSPTLAGAGYGLLVWGANYVGLLPALRVRSNAFNMPARRNGMMIAAHLVWGATLGFTENLFRKNGKIMFDGTGKRIAAE